MNIDSTLIRLAKELVKLLNKTADENLPQEIADVVKLHSKLAVGSAWIPLPGADLAAGAASIWGMYARINSKLGIPFGENVIKSIGSGVATNLVSYVAMAGLASAIKSIPGIGTFIGTVTAGVLLSASLYAVTMTSGWIYLKALCALAQNNGGNITGDDLSAAVDDVLQEKDAIKEFMNEAKSSYKK